MAMWNLCPDVHGSAVPEPHGGHSPDICPLVQGFQSGVLSESHERGLVVLNCQISLAVILPSLPACRVKGVMSGRVSYLLTLCAGNGTQASLRQAGAVPPSTPARAVDGHRRKAAAKAQTGCCGLVLLCVCAGVRTRAAV